MPLDFGTSDLVAAEIDRFTGALEDLSDGGVRRATAAAARRSTGEVTPRALQIPGWDDVIHVVPRPAITPEMRAVHYAATRRGQPSPLAPDLVNELERRTRRARRMQSTFAPAWAQAYGQALTAIDNVQDLLTTLVVAGRLVLNPAIRLLDQLGPTFTETALREQAERRVLLELAGRRAAGELITAGLLADARGLARAAVSREFAAGAFGFGARTVGRLLGPLGWVLLAADLLKLLNLIGLWAFPFYGVWCTGSLGGLAGAAPALLFGKRLKLNASGLANLNPFAHKARLMRSRTLRSWRPSIYNLLEVAQTTDALWGVGVSFGAVVGTITDLGFAIEAGLRGHPVPVDPTPFAESIHKLLTPGLRQVPTSTLPAHRAAAAVLGNGLALHGTQDTYDVEEHLETLVATSAALSLLRPLIASPDMVEAVNLALDTPLAPPTYGRDHVAGELTDAGQLAGGFGRWTLPGAPERLTGDELLTAGPPLVHQALQDLLAPRRDDPAGVALGAIVRRITDRYTLLLVGDPDAVEYTLLPYWQILESLCLENRVVNVASGEAAIWAYFTALETWMQSRHLKHVPAAVLDAYARDFGVALIRALPPDSPLPATLLQ